MLIPHSPSSAGAAVDRVIATGDCVVTASVQDAVIATTFEAMNWKREAAGSHSKNYLPSVDLRRFGDFGGIQADERPWRAVLTARA